MRTIKFRGKRLNDGEWVYGSLVATDSKAWIVPLKAGIGGFADEVDPETVGQFTGIINEPDKVELYEGDIVRGENALLETHVGVIVYQGSTFRHDKSSYSWEGEKIIPLTSSRLLGNIHDNPEMVKA